MNKDNENELRATFPTSDADCGNELIISAKTIRESTDEENADCFESEWPHVSKSIVHIGWTDEKGDDGPILTKESLESAIDAVRNMAPKPGTVLMHSAKDDGRPFWMDEAVKLVKECEDQAYLVSEESHDQADHDLARVRLMDFIENKISESLRMAAEKIKEVPQFEDDTYYKAIELAIAAPFPTLALLHVIKSSVGKLLGKAAESIINGDANIMKI